MVYFLAEIHSDETQNNGMYESYIQQVKPIVESYHGRYLVRSGNIEAFGGGSAPSRVILIEFDTRAQLDKCFASQEYRSIAYLREQSVDGRAYIVEQEGAEEI